MHSLLWFFDEIGICFCDVLTKLHIVCIFVNIHFSSHFLWSFDNIHYFLMKFMFFLWFWLFFSPQDLLTIFAIFVFLGEGDPYTKFMLFLWFIDVIHSCFCDLVFLWIFDKTCSLFMIFWQNSYWKILHGASTFHSFNCQFFTFSCQVATSWCLFSS